MNKQVFMGSMISASETAMKLGITADAQIAHEAALVTAETARVEGESEEKDLNAEETKEAVKLFVEALEENFWGDKLAKKAKAAFILTQKSIRAFYMANKKEEWQIIGYDENLAVFKKMFGVIGTTEDWKKNVENLAAIFEAELELNDINGNVSHDNGAVWKKNKTIAILLAVFFGPWTWLYTYRRDPGKAAFGLGLNISRNLIVQKHQGQITVSSEPGKTCFTVRLPINFYPAESL